MADVEVRNLHNEVVGQLALAEQVFNYSASKTLVWEAVRAFRANQRKGTHATRNRSQVRGGGAKMWKQKGTGRARMGSRRSPLWRGGGTVFGPQPRDYSQAFPKKKRRGAVKLVLTDKLRSQKLLVLDDLQLESHRSKEFLNLLRVLELEGKVLVIDDLENRNLFLSTRNLPQIKLVPSSGVNVYDLLRHDHVVFSRRALLQLQEVLER